MKYICGIAAMILLIAGVMMIGGAVRSGKVFDCMEGSETEQQWVFRHETPRRYGMLIMSYSIIFGAIVFFLGWVAIGGQPMP